MPPPCIVVELIMFIIFVIDAIMLVQAFIMFVMAIISIIPPPMFWPLFVEWPDMPIAPPLIIPSPIELDGASGAGGVAA